MEEHILFRSLKGQTAPAEEAAVRKWRASSSDSERSYQQLAAVLEATAAAEDSIEAEPPSVFKLIHAAESRRSARKSAHATEAELRPRRRTWYGMLAVACALALGVGLGQWRLASPSGGGGYATDVVTAAMETATLRLHDGTVVRLGPESRLRIPHASKAREVSLRGRAFFAVAHDPARPFRISTTAGDVEVLGTRFDIEVEPDDLRVTVVEGQVALAGRGGKSKVRAGEMRRVVQGTALPAVSAPDVTETTSWVGSFLAFQETPLPDAAREIEALYGVSIDITDDRIAAQTITTWFSDQPVEEVLEIFCLVAEARCTTTDGVTTVTPRVPASRTPGNRR